MCNYLVSSKGTGKIVPVHGMKAYVVVEIQFHSFLTSTLDGDEWSASCDSHFIPREITPSSGVARFLGPE
jgi:hypothetical protein